MHQKTSFLVNQQVPEFVREEYPIFVSFLEAYYEFLETEQNGQKNDLIRQAKNLKDITDIDSSIDQFEEYFFNTFAQLIPKDVAVDKAFLIKNILPLYLSKGSEKSFKLLFRLLFDEELNVSFPRNRVLRSSDGKWLVESSLKVSDDISTFYVADGITKQYTLLEALPKEEITVYINGSIVETGFTVLKEYQTIIFDTALSEGTEIEIFYSEITKEQFLSRQLLLNRQVIGESSFAFATIEKVFSRFINNRPVLEFFLNEKTVNGEFDIGETLKTTIFVNNELLTVRMRLLSELNSIIILDGGSSYNIGDPVLVTSQGAIRQPSAFISRVSRTNLDNLIIRKSGAGFQLGGSVFANDIGPPDVVIEINSVLLDSPRSANTYTIFSDVISDIDIANTVISDADYNLSGNTSSGNLNSIIAHCFSNIEYVNIGEIIGLDVQLTQVEFEGQPQFNAEPAKLLIEPIGVRDSNAEVSILTFGSLAKLEIINSGTGYEKGDELVFTNQSDTFGIGAFAEVTNVSPTGQILSVNFVPAKITGNVSVSSNSTLEVTGTGTLFEDELIVGDKIMINYETKIVQSITSNTSLQVDSFFSEQITDKPIRLYGKFPLGGQSYRQDKLPSISILSNSGENAQIQVTAIMGDGEEFEGQFGDRKPGEILEVTVTDTGKGFVSLPELDVSQFGDGNAILEPILVPSFEQFKGRWTTSDSILSSSEIRLQDSNYYINFSYVTKSSIQFSKYKNLLQDLLHPAGFINYAEIIKEVEVNDEKLEVEVEFTIGTV